MINDKEYWREMHTSNFWLGFGRYQTANFAANAIGRIPPDLLVHMRNITVCDFGCALGDALQVLEKVTGDGNRLVGVDFSEAGIAKAKAFYPKYEFICDDKISEMFDVVFCSNTLEHFADPLPLIEHLASMAKKFVIIIVPFQEKEPRCSEHMISFDYDTLPNTVGNHRLRYFYAFKPEPVSIWPHGEQLLVIYSTLPAS